MTIEFFNKKAGENVAVGRDDPTMLLIGLDKPDVINLPRDLGGATRKCLELVVGKCPVHEHSCVHYILEGDIHVAECKEGGGFLWYSKKKEGSS